MTGIDFVMQKIQWDGGLSVGFVHARGYLFDSMNIKSKAAVVGREEQYSLSEGG